MVVREFGQDKGETILLLHGGGLSWWNYREEARLLETDFHVVLPVLDGHAGSDRPFTTIRENAEEIIAYVDEKLGGCVLLIGGLSLGGQILLEMLARRRDLCSHALVESAAVLPSALTHALIGPAFGTSYGLIRNRAFARLQFRSLHMREDLFEDYYRDTCAIGKADMIAFMKANTAYTLNPAIAGTGAAVHVYAGERETREILRSAEVIRAAVSGCSKTLLPGLRHGEFSTNRPEEYAQTIRGLIGR